MKLLDLLEVIDNGTTVCVIEYSTGEFKNYRVSELRNGLLLDRNIKTISPDYEATLNVWIY